MKANIGERAAFTPLESKNARQAGSRKILAGEPPVYAPNAAARQKARNANASVGVMPEAQNGVHTTATNVFEREMRTRVQRHATLEMLETSPPATGGS